MMAKTRKPLSQMHHKHQSMSQPVHANRSHQLHLLIHVPGVGVPKQLCAGGNCVVHLDPER